MSVFVSDVVVTPRGYEGKRTFMLAVGFLMPELAYRNADLHKSFSTGAHPTPPLLSWFW